jgi:hypothetical protein
VSVLAPLGNCAETVKVRTVLVVSVALGDAVA